MERNLKKMNNPDYRFCVAPMMDWTDPHERYFLRLISRRARLYTEMVTTGAVIFGDRNRFLAFSAEEHPVALQLGGSDPQDMALCARLGEDAGFDEININVGCPSDRVQAGRFGACLMREPGLVAGCVSEMRARVSIPVTVKCRIGVDQSDSYEELCEFTQQMSDAGCEVIIVHARKAWLSGLSPKENREIPPLNYPRVYELKRQFPELTVVINGGITTLDEASRHLFQVDGVMVGRAAYQNPWSLQAVDGRIFGDSRTPVSRWDVLDSYKSYIGRQLASGVPLKRMARHLLGLFHGQPGARVWRRTLSECAFRSGAGIDALEAAEKSMDPFRESDIENVVDPVPRRLLNA